MSWYRLLQHAPPASQGVVVDVMLPRFTNLTVTLQIPSLFSVFEAGSHAFLIPRFSDAARRRCSRSGFVEDPTDVLLAGHRWWYAAGQFKSIQV